MLTDNTGLPVWRANYEAFGRAHVSTDPDGSSVTPDPQIQFNLRFGQYYDAESGLSYNRFRYYDANVGRYVSADPIGQGGGANVFQYSQMNPLRVIDLLGLRSLTPEECKKIRALLDAEEQYGTWAAAFLYSDLQSASASASISTRNSPLTKTRPRQ